MTNKLSARQLSRLIKEFREERAHQTQGLGKNVAGVDYPITIRYKGRSEVVYNQDALDSLLDYLVDNGISYSLDSTSELEPEQVPVGSRIEDFGEAFSRREVQRIVNEEKKKMKEADAMLPDNYFGARGTTLIHDEVHDAVLDLLGEFFLMYDVAVENGRLSAGDVSLLEKTLAKATKEALTTALDSVGLAEIPKGGK